MAPGASAGAISFHHPTGRPSEDARLHAVANRGGKHCGRSKCVGSTVKMPYLVERAARACGWSSMSSWDEEMFTMMGGLAVFAVFCIGALLWLV